MSMDVSGEDARLIEEQARQNEEEQEKLALAYGEVARTGAGQFILKDLAERCNYRNSCIRSVNAPDPYAVMFQEGKRAVFNHIMFYVRHDNEKRKAR